MNQRIPFIALLAALLAFPGMGASQTLPFRTYSIENGLSESVAYDMLQDRDGYIWVGTGYGLNRFDGISFRNFYEEDGLNANRIHSLFEDSRGRIWVGTASGVNVIERDSIRSPRGLEPLESSAILEVLEADDGTFWFATDGEGVWHRGLDGSLVRYTTADGLAGDRVRDILQTEQGDLWFGTREGLARYSGGRFQAFTTENGLVDNKIRDLEHARSGGVWIATRGGLSLYSGGRFTGYTEREGLINNRIRTISADREGGLWLGTEEGASHFSDGEFTNYTTGQGLSNNIIYSSLYDREHNIWFGTFGGGINLFLGDAIQNFTIEEGLPNNMITSIVMDHSQNYWVTTYGGGIARYDGETFEVIDTRDGLVDNKVYTATVDSRGRIFFGTRWGLSIYDGGEFINFDENELPYRKIRAIFETVPGEEYWMGTYGEGVLRYRDGEFDLFSEEQGLPNNIVMSIDRDRNGDLWFATYGGVSRYSDGEFVNYTIRDGLPNNGVLDILVDREGTVWAATFGGIAEFTGEGFRAITSEQGLPNEVCYFILEDREGYKWIGTNKGVVRFDKQAYDQGEYPFKLLTQDQGLVADEMNAGAGFADPEGNLWLGSVGGLTRYIPGTGDEREIAPKIHISDIQVSGEPVPLTRSLQMGSESHNIAIEYVGISMIAPEQVTYRYRLRGAAEEWQTTTQRKVRYSALLPGEYTFQVRAQSVDGVWSEEMAELHFSVLPPVWMRWWFILGVLAVTAGVIYFIYHYYRVRKMVEIERMRVRIASDLHDDVGSSLTEIALQTDFLRTTTDLQDEIHKSLSQIGDQSRKIVSSLDDIVWSIDARNDTMGDLTDRMQDYVNNVIPGKEVVYEFGEMDMGEKLTVPMKENIYLIFKEAINNIAKHSDAKRVEVELRHQNGSFDLFVKDNGSGIGGRARKSGHGLRNMKMRAERIDAELTFGNTEGFSVRLHGAHM